MKKSDIIAGALADLDEQTLSDAAVYRKKTKNPVPGIAALAAVILTVLIAVPLIRPLLKDGGVQGTDTNEFPILNTSGTVPDTAEPGKKESATFDERLMKYMPDKEPEDKAAPSYLYYTGIDADVFVKDLRNAGFTLLYEKNGRELLYGDDMLLGLTVYEDTVMVDAFVGHGDASDVKRIINGSDIKNASGTHLAPVSCPVDITPDGFEEATGMRMIAAFVNPGTAEETCRVDTFFVGKNKALRLAGWGWSSWSYDPQRHFRSKIFADIDGDGSEELVILGPGFTSGVMSHSLYAVRCGDEPEYVAEYGATLRQIAAAGLIRSDDGRAVLAYLYGNEDGVGKIGYAELLLRDGYPVLIDRYGREMKTDWGVGDQLAEQIRELPADKTDRFVDPVPFDGYKNFCHDYNVDRELVSRLKVHGKNGRFTLVFAETSETYSYNGFQKKLTERKSPAYTLNLYTADGNTKCNVIYTVGELFTGTDVNIYRWDLDKSEVSTYISVKDRLQNTYEDESGMIFYVSYKGKKGVLKAADTRSQTIYGITEIPVDTEHGKVPSVAGRSDTGIYVFVTGDGLYHCTPGGEAKRLREIPEYITYRKCVDGVMYYIADGTLYAVDQDGADLGSMTAPENCTVYDGYAVSVSKRGITVYDVSGKEPARTVDSAEFSENVTCDLKSGVLFVLDRETKTLTVVNMNGGETNTFDLTQLESMTV